MEGILHTDMLVRPTKHPILILVDFGALINAIFN